MRVVTESLSVLATRVRNGRVPTASVSVGRLAPRPAAVPDAAPVRVAPDGPDAPPPSPWHEPPPQPSEVAGLVRAGGVVGLLAVAAALALSTRTELWLDEAQAVAISRLAPADLLSALRTDGAPPLYYLLLHGWIQLFGSSALAVRALSGLFAAAAIALAPLAAVRIGPRRAAVAAVALLATSPFLLRYATEARMYALVVLLCVAGFVVLHAALARPDRRALAGVAVVTGLLLVTHYWSLFLLAAVGAVVAARARLEQAGG
ncbi:MAG: glycosyltransferase family 39 protein, partial [Actinomycetota bacterium]|nr:glycosyltransferase family 39 protein [Actinomycetota bacterium]